MVHNFYYKCRICNTKFRLRWQVSDLGVNTVLVCPRCGTKIKGEISACGIGFNYNFINAIDCSGEMTDSYGDFVLEISSEFLCKKIRQDVKVTSLTMVMREPELFYNNQRTFALVDYANNVKKYTNDIITAYDLYNNSQYLYLKKLLINDKNPFLKEIKKTIQKYEFKKNIDYLMGIHQYAAILLSKTYIDNTLTIMTNITTEIFSIFESHNSQMLEYVSFLENEKYYIDVNIKFSKLIEAFLNQYKSFLPLYIKECQINVPLDEFGISTLDYEDLENFYKKAYEFICDYIPIVIGLNNIVSRNDFRNFVNCTSDFKTKMNSYLSKYRRFNENIVDNEKFSNLFKNCLDNIIRNSEAHFSTEYNTLTQKVTFRNNYMGNITINEKYLIEFGIDVIKIFQKCCILWEFSYQLNKIYLCFVKGEINSYKNE